MSDAPWLNPARAGVMKLGKHVFSCVKKGVKKSSYQGHQFRKGLVRYEFVLTTSVSGFRRSGYISPDDTV